jgi:hypothetical protein
MHRLGVYWCPGHGRPGDLEYMRQLQPPAIRILDPDVQHISDAHKAAPNALICPRDWALSEQKSDANRDPIATGERHAVEWRDKIDYWRNQAQMRGLPFPQDTQLVIVGINEPNDGVSVNAQVEYTVALCDKARALGLTVSALNLGVGWPGNTGPDTPPNWEPYGQALYAIQRSGHFLTLHEYYYDDPANGWGWYMGRHTKVPVSFQGRILIGECGVDRYVDAVRWQHEGGNRGWRGNMEPDAYAVDLAWYADQCDTRVVAVLPFLTDYRSREWESFDTAPAHDDIVALARMAQGDHTVHIPAVVVQPVNDTPQVTPQVGALDPAVMMAILDVESGAAFGPGGRMVIRFEAHIFKNELRNDALFGEHFRIAESRPWEQPAYFRNGSEWFSIHANQESEWAALGVAQRLNETAALRSISMGRPQIMGFNHGRVGYPSVKAMFAAFADRSSGEAAQIIAFLNYMLTDAALVRAIKERNWRAIAAAYNGVGGVDVYAPRLEAAWRKRAAA